MSHLIDWIALSLVPGLGARGASQLLRSLGDPAAVFSASPADLAAQGLCRDAVLGMHLPHLRPEAEEILKKCEKAGYDILSLQADAYPVMLKQIHDPPIILYLRGRAEVLNRPQVAIVGTRRPSPYGLHAAQRLAEELSFRGLCICSGLARGIDTSAHQGAIKNHGCTVAVFGCGVDIIYPKENEKCARSILEYDGALVSEYPPETFPAPQNFPVRNRIISGLSMGVVVVEASEYSGSLITARMALEQNREVFAVPGNITSEKSVGPNRLIQQGAKLVQTWQDIVEELPFELRRLVLGSQDKEKQKELPLLSDEETRLLQKIPFDNALGIDELCLLEENPLNRIHEILLTLEMKEYVRQMPGKQFVRLC
jgi:DNA processing protein